MIHIYLRLASLGVPVLTTSSDLALLFGRRERLTYANTEIHP